MNLFSRYEADFRPSSFNEKEGFEDIVKDLRNLYAKDRKKPRELPYNSMDFKDDSEEPTNTDELKKLWRQGEEFIAEEHIKITVQAQVHRVEDSERSSSLKTGREDWTRRVFFNSE